MASVEERKQLLHDDPDVAVVEPHRVFCRRCDKWLKLDEVKLYAASVWRCHKNTKSHNARASIATAQFFSQTPDASQILAANASSQSDAMASGSPAIPVKETRERPIKVTFNTHIAHVGEQSRLRSADLAMASPSVQNPRIKITVKQPALPQPIPDGEGPNPPNPSKTAPSSSNAMFSLLSRVKQHDSAAPHSGSTPNRSEFAQGSMLPPLLTLTPATATTSHRSRPLPHAEDSHSVDRSYLTFRKDGEPSVNESNKEGEPSTDWLGKEGDSATNGSRKESEVAIPTPEDLLPERKPSYKALMREPHIGKLEAFRAFCSLCSRWVDLSSRTPYSYGVWKGHVRKSARHNRALAANAKEEYDTESDHSHEDVAATGAMEVGRRTADAPTNAPPPSTATAVMTNGTAAKMKDLFHPHPEDKTSGDQDATSAAVPQTPDMPPPANAPPDTMASNPFALKATTIGSFGPRHLSDDEAVTVEKSNVLEGEVPALTESSDDDTSKQSPTKRASILALERRRQTMLIDVDASIVESRRVKCGICERWIKGSNTQEYSLHHWLKHKKKCIRNKKALEADLAEPVDSRRMILEADPDLKILEAHRAFCNLCNKWVKLSGRTRFSSTHWLQHKKYCLSQSATGGGYPKKQPTLFTTPFENTPEARRDALKLDADIQQVWPDRIQCRCCEQIVFMGTYPPYMPDAWLGHKAQCTARSAAVSNRLQNVVAARKEILENDWHVMTFDPHRVHCRVCNRSVALDNDIPYSLGMWDLHRKECGQPPKRSKREARAIPVRANTGAQRQPGEYDRAAKNGLLSQLRDISEEVKDNLEKLSKVPDPDGDKSEDKDDDIIMADSNDEARSAADDAIVTIDVDGVPPPKDIADSADSRFEYFLLQMDVFSIERERVLCGRCLCWVALDGTELFMMRNWHAHKDICCGPMIASAPIIQSDDEAEAGKFTVAPKQPFAGRINPVTRSMRSLPRGKGKAPALKRALSPVALPPLPSRPRWPGEDERKQQFLNDPDVLRIEPHRLLCRICVCWIRLHPVVRYLQGVWPKHKVACKSVQLHNRPGDARGKAKSDKEDIRRITLEEDPYIGDIGPHRVSCKACGTSIRLDTTYKYEGSHWRAHRARCAQIPFLDRITKRRKGQDNSQYQDTIATANSSDSEDSDASSAPRPRPTAVFTAPLEINPMKMFRARPPVDDLPTLTIGAAKAKLDAELLVHLKTLAEDLSTSDRLSDLINTFGDGITSEERLAKERWRDAANLKVNGNNSDPIRGKETQRQQLAPTPDPEVWMPRKRTREEDAEFNIFFNKRPRPESPAPKGKLRVCRLDKGAMKMID